MVYGDLNIIGEFEQFTKVHRTKPIYDLGLCVIKPAEHAKDHTVLFTSQVGAEVSSQSAVRAQASGMLCVQTLACV